MVSSVICDWLLVDVAPALIDRNEWVSSFLTAHERLFSAIKVITEVKTNNQ